MARLWMRVKGGGVVRVQDLNHLDDMIRVELREGDRSLGWYKLRDAKLKFR